MRGFKRKDARYPINQMLNKLHPISQLKLSLYDHQKECRNFLTQKLISDKWAALIHDAGLGKTTTIIATWAKLKKKNPNLQLIVSCPACTLNDVWNEHIKMWLDPSKVSVLIIDKGSKLDNPKNDPANYDITIITRNLISVLYKKHWVWVEKSEEYETANGQIRHRGAFQYMPGKKKLCSLFKAKKNDTLFVIDESHYLRNYGAKKVCLQAHHQIAIHCKYSIINTATPVCNKPEDVAGQLYAIALDYKGMTEEIQDMADPKSWKIGQYVINSKAVELFKSNCHRKTDKILRLPEITYHRKEFFINLPQKYKVAYNNLLLEAREIRSMQENKNGEIGIERLRKMLSNLNRMSQMVIHTKLFKHGAKNLNQHHLQQILKKPSPMLIKLSKLTKKISKHNKKIIIFGLHSNSTMAIAKMRLEKDCPGSYHTYCGKLSQIQRSAMIKKFLAPSEELQVIFIQMIAGGVGLNLVPGPTAAIFIQQSWNPMDHLQAAKRIHRIGQKQPVHIYNLVCNGTPDDAILTIHEDKMRAAEAVTSEETDILTELEGQSWRTKGRAVDLCKIIE